MAHRGQTYRVYNQSTVVVKRSSIHSDVTFPEKTAFAASASSKRELEDSHV